MLAQLPQIDNCRLFLSPAVEGDLRNRIALRTLRGLDVPRFSRSQPPQRARGDNPVLFSRQGALLEGIQSTFKAGGDHLPELQEQQGQVSGELGRRAGYGPSESNWCAEHRPGEVHLGPGDSATGDCRQIQRTSQRTATARTGAVQIGSRAVYAGLARAGAGVCNRHQCRRMFCRNAHPTPGQGSAEAHSLGRRCQASHPGRHS
jgi:hypothetical protein